MGRLLCLFFVFLIPFGCTKIISESHPYVNLLESTKQHYYYQKGSYWIYKDSISGRIDSCYLSSARLDTFSSLGRSVEHLIVRMNQYPVLSSLSDSVFYQFEIYPGDNFYFDGSKKYLSDNNELNFFSTRLPLSPDSSFSSQWNYSVSVEANKILVLGPNRFTNVFEIKTNQSSAKNNGRTIFFNEEQGLIKMRLYTEDAYRNREDKVWELQRWHLVK